jgi:hypothetical protein
MQLPNGEWLMDPYGRDIPLVKLNKTLYGIKQETQEYYEEVFESNFNDLVIKALITALGLVFSGKISQSNGVLIPVYVDDIMIIGYPDLVNSISSQLYN